MLKTVKNIVTEYHNEEQEYIKQAKRGKNVRCKSLLLIYFQHTSLDYLIILAITWYISSEFALKVNEKLGLIGTSILIVSILLLFAFVMLRQLHILVSITFKYPSLLEELGLKQSSVEDTNVVKDTSKVTNKKPKKKKKNKKK